MDRPSKSNYYHYNKKLQPFARKLRSEMTKSEACLWKYVLGARQMMGYQFRRQRPVLKYIADFMCKELSLIIEVDGITHDAPEAVMKDQVRDQKLKEAGFHILRFTSTEILNQISAVSEAIVEWINLNAKSPPPVRNRRRLTPGPPPTPASGG